MRFKDISSKQQNNNEINTLRRKGLRLFKMNDYEVFVTKYDEIPSLIYEIGRLREITYKEIGAGTGKHIDVDIYDTYYNHLLIWNSSNKEIIGGARIGVGSLILNNYGVNGFYSFSLFQIDSKLDFLLSNSIELGRVFIIKEYQRKVFPLLLIWKGILSFVSNYPKNNYLFGCVSFGNILSDVSKNLIIQFIKKYHYNEGVAKYISPLKKFRVTSLSQENSVFLESIGGDIEMLDHYIYNLEKRNSRIPVLVKNLLKQNAKIIGFNIDVDFNNSIDGLIFFEKNDISRKYKLTNRY